MRLVGTNILGLVLQERSILCAQVAAGASVRRLARFDTSQKSIFDNPDQVGRELRTFLDQHQLTTKSVVVGVPARWVIAQEADVPPIGEDEAHSILRLAGERMSPTDAGQLIVDYVGVVGKNAARVLLVGILRPQLDRITKLCNAAGLSIEAIAPTSLIMSSVLDKGKNHLVHLSSDSAELVILENTVPRILRPLSAADVSNPTAVGIELKRTIAMRPLGSGQVVVCDGLGWNATQRTELITRSGIASQLIQYDLPSPALIPQSALNGSSSGLTPATFLPAVALALAGLDRDRIPVNFADSKLKEKPESKFTNKALIAICVTAFAVLALVALWFMVSARESKQEELFKQLKDRKPEIENSKTTIDHVMYGRTYFDLRPPHLNCMRELTMAFNYDEAIWVTSMTFRDNRQGQFQGKATDKGLITSLLDRLKNNAKFANVQLLDLREAGSRDRDFTFSISFNYTGQ